MKIVGVIPARYKSSRFPGKPIVDLCGKPMIWWVYQNASKVKEFEDVYVATDEPKIKDVCKKYGIKCIMTKDTHPTGTDRIAEFAQKIDADLYVDIQVDEPLMKPETIKQVILPFKKDKDLHVSNLMTEIREMADLLDSGTIKVVFNPKKELVYMSRQPIPYRKGTEDVKYYKQVCAYGFSPYSLDKYINWKRGPAESAEDIEILRYIEHGIRVQMVEVKQDTVGVDTPKDLAKVSKILSKKK